MDAAYRCRPMTYPGEKSEGDILASASAIMRPDPGGRERLKTGLDGSGAHPM